MTQLNIVNKIASFTHVYVGDDDFGAGGFLGWLRLSKPNGEDAGYIYLSDRVQGPHIGGRSQAGGPYVVMSRPVVQAPIILALLNSGRPLVIQYVGEDNGDNSSAFLREDLELQVTGELRDDVTTNFRIKLP